jgi:hypothetical protein
MTRPYDRPATLAAFVNGVIVYLLPIAMVGAIALFASDYSNGGTRVVGVDPDRAAAWSRRLQFIRAYIVGVAPFAMAAAWRTFIHARRRLESGSRGGQGILEAAGCGFAGAVIVLLPGILTQPTQAPPYLLLYGGLATVVGLAVGVVLWIGATVTLKLYARQVYPGPSWPSWRRAPNVGSEESKVYRLRRSVATESSSRSSVGATSTPTMSLGS